MLGRDYKENALRERVDSVYRAIYMTVVTYTYTLSGIIGMHDHVQQSFSPSLTHRYRISGIFRGVKFSRISQK